jgi:hypothetical protein
MKHIIIILSSAILLTSCGKVPKCWECTRTIKYPPNSKHNLPEISTFKMCDKTKGEIKEFESSSTTTSTDINTITFTTQCR